MAINVNSNGANSAYCQALTEVGGCLPIMLSGTYQHMSSKSVRIYIYVCTYSLNCTCFIYHLWMSISIEQTWTKDILTECGGSPKSRHVLFIAWNYFFFWVRNEICVPYWATSEKCITEISWEPALILMAQNIWAVFPLKRG